MVEPSQYNGVGGGARPEIKSVVYCSTIEDTDASSEEHDHRCIPNLLLQSILYDVLSDLYICRSMSILPEERERILRTIRERGAIDVSFCTSEYKERAKK